MLFLFGKILGFLFLESRNISIIANNCIGGKLYHDFGLRFNSPFVDVSITMEHYIKICQHLKEYMDSKLEEIEVTDEIQRYFTEKLKGGLITFPVGKLTLKNGEYVLIFFQHENDFKKGMEKWNRRKERINYDNLFYVAVIRLNNINGENICAEFEKATAGPNLRSLLLTIDKPFKNKGKKPSGIYTCCMHCPPNIHFLQRIPNKLHCYYHCFPYFRWFLGVKIKSRL